MTDPVVSLWCHPTLLSYKVKQEGKPADKEVNPYQTPKRKLSSSFKRLYC